MPLDLTTRKQIETIIDLAVKDVEFEIFEELKSRRGEYRESELNQLDALERAKGRIYARLQYGDPCGTE